MLKQAMCVVLLAMTSTAAASPPTDFTRCSRIVDVKVPDETRVAESSITFAGKPQITVTESTVMAGDRSFNDPSVKAYYVALRGFLTESSSMAIAAKAFDRAKLSKAAGAMCQSILALQATGQVVEQRFAGFISPVRVKLK